MTAYNVTRRGSSFRVKVVRDGKQHTRTVKTDSERDAQRQAAQFAAEIDGGVFAVKDTGISFGRYLDDWLDGLRKAPLTLINYRSCVRKHLKPALGHLPLSKVSALDVKIAFETFAKTLKPSTMGQVRIILSSALRDAERFDMIRVTPMRRLRSSDLPVGRSEKAVPVPFELVRELIDEDCSNTGRDYPIALLLIAVAGLRRGEALGAKWHDLDFDTGTLKIERQLSPLGEFCAPKSKHGTRSIRLPADIVERLRLHRVTVIERCLRYGHKFTDEAPIAASPIGFHLSPLLFTAWGSRRGIKLHAVRHWHLSELVNSGRPISEVAKIAGHANVTQIVNTYLHAPIDDGAAAAVIGAKLFGR